MEKCITKIKILMDRLNSKMEGTEERISKIIAP